MNTITVIFASYTHELLATKLMGWLKHKQLLPKKIYKYMRPRKTIIDNIKAEYVLTITDKKRNVYGLPIAIRIFEIPIVSYTDRNGQDEKPS